MRESNLFKIRFVTNTTKESKSSLLRLLNNLGFDITEEEVFSSLSATRQLIEKKHVRPLLLLDDSALEDFDGKTKTSYQQIVSHVSN